MMKPIAQLSELISTKKILDNHIPKDWVKSCILQPAHVAGPASEFSLTQSYVNVVVKTLDGVMHVASISDIIGEGIPRLLR
jgi:hypothetical protein